MVIILKNIERKQKFVHAKNMHIGWKIFTCSLVSYVTIDFQRVVSDQFHAGSILVECECVKRETRPWEYPQRKQ